MPAPPLILAIASILTFQVARGLRRSRLGDEAWARSAERAVGSVVVRSGTDPLSKNRHISEEEEVGPTVRVTFRAKDGAPYSFQPRGSRLTHGASVDVFYDGRSPSTATLARTPSGLAPERLAFAVGGWLLLAAVVNSGIVAR